MKNKRKKLGYFLAVLFFIPVIVATILVFLISCIALPMAWLVAYLLDDGEINAN